MYRWNTKAQIKNRGAIDYGFFNHEMIDTIKAICARE